MDRLILFFSVLLFISLSDSGSLQKESCIRQSLNKN